MPDDAGGNSILRVFSEVPSTLPSIIGLAAITAVALWVAARTVESREYVLEQ
jgi:hypothetical protein